MNKFQRFKTILYGLIMLACAVILVIDTDKGYLIVLFIANISLLLMSFQQFSYYVTMARYMVDGRRVLYKSLLMFDLAVFVLALTNIPTYLLAVYAAGIICFAGAIDIMYAMQAKKLQSPIWKRKIGWGALEVIVGITCVCFIKNTRILVYIYALMMLYHGVLKISEALRKTAIVYVQ